MKKLLYFFLFVPICLFSQITITATTPADNAINVPVTASFSLTFSKAIDTIAFHDNFDKWTATNIDSGGHITYGGDGKSFTTTIFMKPSKAYFFGMFGLKAKDGSVLVKPFGIHFTTASSFPTNTVSGTILSGITGVSPVNSFVGLSLNDIRNSSSNGPTFGAWGNVNTDGTFSIPYVPNGTYWPLAAKDVNNDGNIDPNQGIDVVALGDSIIINNASLSNVSLTFTKFTPLTFAEALPIADSIAKNLPVDRLLKSVRSNNTDTLGRCDGWGFTYTINSNTQAKEIRVSSFESRIEQITDVGYISSLINLRTLTNPSSAANSPVVIGNTEVQGGKVFRLQAHPDSLTLKVELQLGDLSNSNFWDLNPNPTLNYWGVSYSFGVERPSQWTEYSSKKFLCDFTTGTVLPTLGVNQDRSMLPSEFKLHQNYPNPFNPTTVISYQISANSFVTLKVYDLLGREVAFLVNEKVDAGNYSTQWNASSFPSGIYFYRLEANEKREMKKMVLLK
ncbi:MAG: T9SS type A sorting domain-containing protein [Bacteroidota bacterium]|nr:T9SS type A sorting domain-containing protein [Bacteroidota bacterium]